MQALAIAGGLSAGCIALYTGLTAAGVGEVLAGNLLLLVLAGIGSYLIFFDGGTTQAALQAQAVQEVARNEGDLMDAAPLDEQASCAGLLAAAVAVDGAEAERALGSDGLVRVDSALEVGTAEALRKFVDANLLQSLELVREGKKYESQLFGAVLSRANRFDLLLPLSPTVKAAMVEALRPLRGIISSAVHDEAELFELAALISDPGAPRQPLHPDTPLTPDPTVCTAFVALQDIDDSMGATFFLPGTNRAAAHDAFNEGGTVKDELLRTSPRVLGLLKQGDVSLFDSRLLHGGGANLSGRRRVLFYFSFKAQGARVPTGSMRRELRGEHRLADFL